MSTLSPVEAALDRTTDVPLVAVKSEPFTSFTPFRNTSMNPESYAQGNCVVEPVYEPEDVPTVNTSRLDVVATAEVAFCHPEPLYTFITSLVLSYQRSPSSGAGLVGGVADAP